MMDLKAIVRNMDKKIFQKNENKTSINRYNFTQHVNKQKNCEHDWNEVRVWSLGATYIKYCNKCNAKETFTKS